MGHSGNSLSVHPDTHIIPEQEPEIENQGWKIGVEKIRVEKLVYKH